jgi:hypothetical protein
VFINYDEGGNAGISTQSTLTLASNLIIFVGTAAAFTGGPVVNNGTILGTGLYATLQITDEITNNGLIDASLGGNIQFAAGSLQNISGTTLTGGSFEVDANSTMTFASPIATNAANITLDGAGYAFAAISSLITNSGAFKVMGGAVFTTAAAFTNSELFPNPVDGRDNLSGKFFTVDEHDAVDQVL